MVSAFAAANGVVIAQTKTDAKSNDITAITDLLNLLDIKCFLITIDATGCQHKITNTIVDKAVAYLLTVNGKLLQLYNIISQPFACTNKTSTLHINKGHRQSIPRLGRLVEY
ncbi:MAG: putative transposase YbfD/YdcC [Paraglaciecola sp.]|jgi:predicted transposase YbfD/YdcC